MKTVGEILQLSLTYLKAKDPSFLRRDLELLLASILGYQRLDLYLNTDRPLQEDELKKIREGVKRLAAHEPIQYIEGVVDFFNCKIQVNRHVLIPRPETELLVEKIALRLAQQDLVGKQFVDLCCGSGCIGIAIKKKFPELDVLLLDLSKDALAVAEKNAQQNQVQVRILEGDLLQPIGNARVNFLVSNPPYLSHIEYEMVDPSVKHYEPREALIAGNTGLEFYRRIAKEAKNSVTECIWLEIGSTQGASVIKIFQDVGYVAPLLEKDFSDLDRFLCIEIHKI